MLQIAETYSFLPREAVTRFLMACSDCQKRMHLSINETNNNHAHPKGAKAAAKLDATAAAAHKNAGDDAHETTPSWLHPTPLYPHPATAEHGLIDFSLPITTTYLNYLRTKGELAYQDLPYHYQDKEVRTAA